MRYLKHPATIIAVIALFVALGGGAAFASGLISGSQIKNHSIAAKKLTKKAIKSLHGQRGPRGATGATGATGPAGPQGPGGATVAYYAAAKATPTITSLGTFLGDTISASCGTTAGDAELNVYLQTSDGSWTIDYSVLAVVNGALQGDAEATHSPGGTYSTPQQVDQTEADAGTQSNSQINFVQLGPSAGSMVWHEQALTGGTGPVCHLSVQAIPETYTNVAGTPHATAGPTSHVPTRLTPR
jgi:hypothetical protein